MRAIRLIRTFGQESYICRRYCALQPATNDVAVEASTEETPKKSTKKVKVPRNAKVPTNIHDATKIVKENARAKFDETVEMIVNLDVDPRKQNQVVKGVASLPSGLGKTTRVAVFAVGGDIQAALAAGADVAGGEDLIQTVQAGKIDFDRVIATPEIMSKLSKIGRVSIQSRYAIYPL
jgi:large subunit ribosomal protein L1